MESRGKQRIISGYSDNGLPYVRISGGKQNLVIFEGLSFNHRPLSGFSLLGVILNYRSFAKQFTIYYLSRKPGMPKGYSIADMAKDYAVMIRDEIGEPVDLVGISTGGAMALQLTLDYPEMVRRLVLAMTGYCLSEEGAEIQRTVYAFSKQNKWRDAAAAMGGGMARGSLRPLLKGFFWILGKSAFGSPSGPSDGMVELEAEEKFDFRDRLAGLKVPVLVIGGDEDCFYPIRETASRIPNVKMVLYKNIGHTAMANPRFNSDILKFLTSNF